MTDNEAQANPDIISGIMTIFGSPTQVPFYFGSSRSFVNISFALHVNQELSALKHKLVVVTPLENR